MRNKWDLNQGSTSACNGETVGLQVGDRGGKVLNMRYGFFLQRASFVAMRPVITQGLQLEASCSGLNVLLLLS